MASSNLAANSLAISAVLTLANMDTGPGSSPLISGLGMHTNWMLLALWVTFNLSVTKIFKRMLPKLVSARTTIWVFLPSSTSLR